MLASHVLGLASREPLGRALLSDHDIRGGVLMTHNRESTPVQLEPERHGVGARTSLLVAALACAALWAGCGGDSPTAGGDPTRAGLERYVREVEPIRLAVNRLLEGADPVLGALHSRRLSRVAAAARMGALERRFAAYAVDVAAIRPRAASLHELHEGYAQTYVFEDAYLSALAAGVARTDFSELPHTQAEQRAAIIRWRVGLEVLARELGASLPADLQAAGRGEIAPSPQGGS
jgi:hypothetical protein